MNIQKAIKKGMKYNQAIRGKKWPIGVYMYHGMDNIMYFNHGDKVNWSVALLKADDYELERGVSYHGSDFSIAEDKCYENNNN